VLVPAAYTFVDLGTIGGESSYASASNDRGEILGASRLSDGTEHRVP